GGWRGVDGGHGFGEGSEWGGEVGELTVEVLLALALIAQLVDGGEIHRAEPLDVGACGAEALFPGRDVSLRWQLRLHGGELATALRELLGERRTAHVRLLRRETRLLHRLACRLH